MINKRKGGSEGSHTEEWTIVASRPKMIGRSSTMDATHPELHLFQRHIATDGYVSVINRLRILFPPDVFPTGLYV